MFRIDNLDTNCQKPITQPVKCRTACFSSFIHCFRTLGKTLLRGVVKHAFYISRGTFFGERAEKIVFGKSFQRKTIVELD